MSSIGVAVDGNRVRASEACERSCTIHLDDEFDARRRMDDPGHVNDHDLDERDVLATGSQGALVGPDEEPAVGARGDELAPTCLPAARIAGDRGQGARLERHPELRGVVGAVAGRSPAEAATVKSSSTVAASECTSTSASTPLSPARSSAPGPASRYG